MFTGLRADGIISLTQEHTERRKMAKRKTHSASDSGKKSQAAPQETQSLGWRFPAELEAEIAKARAGDIGSRPVSLLDSASARAEEIASLTASSPAMEKTGGGAFVKDHYSNALSSTGNADKAQTFTSYGFSADTLNWPLWLALYNDSWVFRRAIDKPAQDEILSGFTLHGDRDYSRAYKTYAKYKNDLTDLLTWGALFGGSVAVMLFDGVKDLSKPLTKAAIEGKRFKLYVVDRWYGVSPSMDDLVGNMKDIDYGKPKWYDITMADGRTQRVHHSWVIRYEHRTAPKLIKNGQLQGWGYSEGSHIINELARDDQLKTSITSLVNKSLIEVIHMAGMRGVFMGTDKGNETQLRKRLEMVNWGRTFNSLTFLDKDDVYEHFELTGLSGLAELMEKNMWLISSALEMQGVLFGDLKGGLSQESDAFSRYAKTIVRRCDAYYRPPLQKFLKVMFMSFGWEESPDFDFDSLDKLEDAKKKMDAMNTLTIILNKMESDGVISKYQYAKVMRSFANEEVISLDFSDEMMNKLKLEEEQAMLDTIKEIGVKRHTAPRERPGGGIDFSNPFGSPSASAMNEPSLESEPDEEISSEEPEPEPETAPEAAPEPIPEPEGAPAENDLGAGQQEPAS